LRNLPGVGYANPMSNHRRPVPARVVANLERARSNAAGHHTDRRRAASARGCRGKALRDALREHGY
jgi:hypothetical protein